MSGSSESSGRDSASTIGSTSRDSANTLESNGMDSASSIGSTGRYSAIAIETTGRYSRSPGRSPEDPGGTVTKSLANKHHFSKTVQNTASCNYLD